MHIHQLVGQQNVRLD